jgi:hypothetical protein
VSTHRTPRRSTSTRVKIGHDDPTLTGHAGLLLTGELVRRLEVVETIEEAVNRVRRFKLRQRGLNAGELMVSLAETVMVGGDHLVHLDQLRGDLAGAELRAVAATPAPTTAGQLLKRFTLGQCRAVVAAMAELGNRFDRQHELAASAPVTLDMDGTLSEVYGRNKEMASFNHEGRRGFLSVLVTWDERRRILAADLLKGSASEKPGAAALLRRALQALPQGHGPVSLRVDSGFYTVELLEACRRQRVEFCVSVARTEAMWTRLYAKLNVKSWRPALDMEGAEVAEFAYTPGGWKHEPLRAIVRRVRVAAEEVSGDGRSRRRRTIPKGQMELLARGRVGYVCGDPRNVVLGSGALLMTPIDQPSRRSRCPDDAAAEEIKLGASEHLTLEHLEPVDVAFDRPGAPAQREAGDDRILIAAHAGHEGVQVG